MRVYETSSHKFSRELSRDFPVISINDYTRLVAERIPEEELEAEDSQFVQVFHFQNEPSRIHGIPFRFLIQEVCLSWRVAPSAERTATLMPRQGERFSDTKKRLEKRTGLKGKSFEKIKFAVVRRMNYSKPLYLKDGTFLRTGLPLW